MRRCSTVGVMLGVFAAEGCADRGAPERHDESRSRVVYGQDDREEQDECPPGSLTAAWARSSALLIARSSLTIRSGGEVALGVEQRLCDLMKASGKPLCPGEPFQDQPVLGGACSAFLVAPDLVITAGHCVIAARICPLIAFVFGAGYTRADRDPRLVGPDDVYSCRDLPEVAVDGVHGDHAVVRLDRPVVGREPLPLRRSGKVEDDEELVLIGNPLSLPTKIAAHGKVLDNTSPLYFKASTDSYGGGSGSVVMGARSGLVEGVLVRGEDDFVRAGDCWVSRVCPPDGGRCRGESVSRATEFAAHVPEQAASWPLGSRRGGE